MSNTKETQTQNTGKLSPKVVGGTVIGVIAIIAIIAFVSQPPAGLVTLPNETDTTTTAPVIGEIKTFIDSGKQIELQGGKTVMRLISTTWCPHCKWIKTTYDKVVNEYIAAGKIVAYHWELDTKDNTLTPLPEGVVPATEQNVFSEFSTGGVPTYVFGGKYYRVGNGYESQNDLASEEAEFRAVIETLIAEASNQ